MKPTVFKGARGLGGVKFFAWTQGIPDCWDRELPAIMRVKSERHALFNSLLKLQRSAFLKFVEARFPDDRQTQLRDETDTGANR